ncbi:MAG: DoxX family protein [Candidatus Pacebacteria bacterium]|nr:DoxX family protein [Candidatus Paceibacterota bacterium]MDR3582868.1 DoxX family protein [Candidatus Paceibacterota bacterium]
MSYTPFSKTYENWAPVVGRIFIASVFLAGAWFKIPGTAGFSMEAGFTAAAGVPLAGIAVFLAFLLEVISGAALIIGWKTRPVAFILVLYIILLTLIFHLHFGTPQDIGMFIEHLALIGGLLYISVLGAPFAAVTKDMPL